MAAPPMGNAARLALLCLIFGGLATSWGPIIVRLSEVGPVATAAYRMGFALPVLLLMLAVSRPTKAARVPTTGRDTFWLCFAGFCFAGDIGVWHWAINLTTIANATLIGNTAPAFVTLGAWLFLRERITGLFVVGLFVALSGAAMLAGASLEVGGTNLLGDGLSIVAAVFFAGYVLAIKHVRGRVATLTIMTWSTGSAGLFLLPAALLTGDTMLAATTFGWLLLLALAWGAHVFGQGLIAYALAHLPVSFSSVALMCQPVFSIVWAALLLSETPGPLEAAGAIVVLVGIIISQRGSARTREDLPATPPP